jgi:hypothetical protein
LSSCSAFRFYVCIYFIRSLSGSELMRREYKESVANFGYKVSSDLLLYLTEVFSFVYLKRLTFKYPIGRHPVMVHSVYVV